MLKKANYQFTHGVHVLLLSRSGKLFVSFGLKTHAHSKQISLFIFYASSYT